MVVKGRIRLADIEAKYDVNLKYFDIINFVINDKIEYSYYKYPIIIGQQSNETHYVQKRFLYNRSRKDYNRLVENNKQNKRFTDIIYHSGSIGLLTEDKTFTTIKNKLSAYWQCGYEINIIKTNIEGNSFKELNIVLE